MKLKMLLIMGLLSLGLNINAQKQKNKQEGILGDVLTKEQLCKEEALKWKPIYEGEIKALATADTLYLIDRKHVNLRGCHYDDAKLIALTSEEKNVIVEAYSKGEFAVLDFNRYDEFGNLLCIENSNDIVEPLSLLPYNAYLFAVKGKDAENVYTISYIHRKFRVCALDFDVTISDKWKEKVNAIIKKYCPDSYSQSEEYWENKRREEGNCNTKKQICEGDQKSLATTDTLYLVDRKYVSICPEFVSHVTTKEIPLTNEEKELIAEAYSKGTFVLYDEDGNIEYLSESTNRDEEPAAIGNPVDYYAYLFLAKERDIPYKHGEFGNQRYRVTLSGEWKEKVEAIIKKYCPDSFSKSEEYWKTYKNEYFPPKERGL